MLVFHQPRAIAFYAFSDVIAIILCHYLLLPLLPYDASVRRIMFTIAVMTILRSDSHEVKRRRAVRHFAPRKERKMPRLCAYAQRCAPLI